jgi:hypothetical protein
MIAVLDRVATRTAAARAGAGQLGVDCRGRFFR